MTDFLDYVKGHAARIIGVILGIVIPVLWWSIGFWKTLALAVCVVIGYFLGRIIDDREWFYRLLERILPRKEE